jgi:hypothetical protein
MVEPQNERTPDGPDPLTARRRRTFEFVGTGALVQLLGLFALGAAVYLGFLVPSFGWGWLAIVGNCAVWGLGLVVCTVLFMLGSRRSGRFACRNCRGRLPDKYAAECPHCRATLR